MTSKAPISAADLILQETVRRARARKELRSKVDEWSDERGSLRSYIPVVHRTDTGQPAYPPAHLLTIIEALQDDSLGNTLILAPPGSAKTNTLIAANSWWLGQDPTKHLGYFSNTDRQAYRRSVAVRDTVTKSSAYASIFPDLVPDVRKGWAEFEWYLQRPDVNDKDASFMAAGVGAAIQGARLDRISLDDIADKKNMATALQRQKVIDWLVDQVMTRLHPQGRAAMIATRWHAEDPAAWAIKQGWRVIRIKGLNDDGTTYWPERWPITKVACPGDLHGQGDAYWMPSEEQPFAPCWIDRDPVTGEVIRQGNCQKYVLGTRGFNLTWQGETTDDESAIFKRAWWKRFSPDDIRALPMSIVGIFLDLAHEEKTEADYTVAGAWRNVPPRYFLQDLFRARLEFPEVVELLLWLVSRPTKLPAQPVLGILRSHGIDAKLQGYRPPFEHWPIFIEETPGSKPLIQTLRRQVPGVMGWPIEGRSKLARAEATVIYAEAGNVFLPEDAPWVGEFIEEHAQFPMGEHDDQVDTTTMALLRFTRGGEVNAW